MKLSQAILLGGSRPQCYGRTYRYCDDGIIETCVFLDVYETVFGKLPEMLEEMSIYAIIAAIGPFIDDQLYDFERASIYVPGRVAADKLADGVVYLSDTLKWPRQRIAHYLEEYGY